MTSTITEPGPYDALEKARPGEPVFPLLGRDAAAPGAVTEWARIRRNRAFRQWGDSKRSSDKKLLAAELEQCANAERVAIEMDEYRESQGGDNGPGERASYSEVRKTDAERQEAARRERVKELVRNLREAAYHLCEARDGLFVLELIGETSKNDLTLMLARINGLADEHTAKRGEA